MAERLVVNVAIAVSIESNPETAFWCGALLDDGVPIWICNHEHPDDIAAEFCSLDELIAHRPSDGDFGDFEEDDYDDIWED